jgi:transposase-like protein
MMIDELRKVIKRLHYPLEVMLVCVRWDAAYPLSLRHIEEMMGERGVFVDHATVHRWAIKLLPTLALVLRRRTPGRRKLADGRDLCQGLQPVEVSVPRRRSRGPHR